jgi:hypothetical protein
MDEDLLLTDLLDASPHSAGFFVNADFFHVSAAWRQDGRALLGTCTFRQHKTS